MWAATRNRLARSSPTVDLPELWFPEMTKRSALAGFELSSTGSNGMRRPAVGLIEDVSCLPCLRRAGDDAPGARMGDPPRVRLPRVLRGGGRAEELRLRAVRDLGR